LCTPIYIYVTIFSYVIDIFLCSFLWDK
jgi:hypothetical protein